MNKERALNILNKVLSKYRQCSYSELSKHISSGFDTTEIKEGDETYQVSIYAHWDGKKGGAIRVCGAIDNGGFMNSHFPLNSDFIMAPDGSFIDE